MAFGKSEPLRWYNFWVCFAIALGTVAYGYYSAVIGPTLGKTDFLQYMNLGDAAGVYPGKTSLTGAITGVFQAGAVVGILTNTFIIDRWGRKAGMAYCSILCIIGAVGLTASQNIGMFIAFRFFAGAGSWAFLAVTPLYTSELAPPAYRGFFSGMVGVMLGLGYACSSFFGLAFYFSNNAVASWRAPLGLALLWPLLILVILPFIPESPRFLLMADRHEEAWKVVSALYKDPQDPDQPFARREFYQMQQQAAFDRTVTSTWAEMFRRPSYRKRSIMGIAFGFITQSTAVLVINNYGPTFYKQLGFGTRDQLILHAGRDSVAFLGNLVGSLLMDNFGRRRLILTGIAGCIVTLCIEAAMVSLYATAGTNKAGLGVGICAFFVFLVFYAVGVDAAGFVWLSEIFPNFIRTKGLALAVTSIAITDVIYLQVTPQAFANIGYKYFLVFIFISAVGYIWLYFTLPETSGLPLEEIAALFGDKDEIMVYSADILVDQNTHKLVVHDHQNEDAIARVATEQYKPDLVQKELA